LHCGTAEQGSQVQHCKVRTADVLAATINACKMGCLHGPTSTAKGLTKCAGPICRASWPLSMPAPSTVHMALRGTAASSMGSSSGCKQPPSVNPLQQLVLSPFASCGCMEQLSQLGLAEASAAGVKVGVIQLHTAEDGEPCAPAVKATHAWPARTGPSC
jgi:hypothetical protein